ncbi:hypothetical protein ABNF65_10535 [Paenibacillus larvae]
MFSNNDLLEKEIKTKISVSLIAVLAVLFYMISYHTLHTVPTLHYLDLFVPITGLTNLYFITPIALFSYLYGLGFMEDPYRVIRFASRKKLFKKRFRFILFISITVSAAIIGTVFVSALLFHKSVNNWTTTESLIYQVAVNLDMESTWTNNLFLYQSYLVTLIRFMLYSLGISIVLLLADMVYLISKSKWVSFVSVMSLLFLEYLMERNELDVHIFGRYIFWSTDTWLEPATMGLYASYILVLFVVFYFINQSMYLRFNYFSVGKREGE